MKLLLESWRQFINEAEESSPQIITVDFDDTLRMSDSGTVNGPVVLELIKLRDEGARIYVVTSRRNSWEQRLEVQEFMDDLKKEPYGLTIDGIFLTNTRDKWYTLIERESDMHFDDDDDEFKAVKDNIEEFPEDKQNIKLMKVDEEGKFKEWKEDLDEIIKKKGDEHCLQSKKGKNLGCYPSKAGAEKREKQVRYFKHKDK
jgi:hypothetical protein